MGKSANLWKEISFVMRAKNRKTVLKTLITPQTPASISAKTKIGLNSTSRALRELDKAKLVVCKTPKLKVGRIYILTHLGNNVLKKVD